MNDSNRPIRAFRMGPLTLSVWENQTEVDGRTTLRRSATIQKRFRDKGGEWRDTGTLFADDLLRLSVLAQRAAVWMELKAENPREPSESSV